MEEGERERNEEDSTSRSGFRNRLTSTSSRSSVLKFKPVFFSLKKKKKNTLNDTTPDIHPDSQPGPYTGKIHPLLTRIHLVTSGLPEVFCSTCPVAGDQTTDSFFS